MKPIAANYAFARVMSLLAAAAAALFLTNWPTYQFVVLNGPLALYYYVIPVLVAAPLLLAKPELGFYAVRHPVSIWLFVYVGTGLIWLLLFYSQLDADSIRQWRLRLLTCLLFVNCYVLTAECNRKLVATVILACVFIAATDNWLDFLFPFNFVPLFTEYSNPGRGAGLFINANQAAYAIISMTIVALPFINPKRRMLALLIMLAGVYPTYSRSGLLFALIVMLAAWPMKLVDRRHFYLGVIAIPILLSAVLVLQEYGTNFGDFDIRNINERTEFFLTGGEAFDDSANERRYVADLALQMFEDNPLVGQGIGSTLMADYGRGTHNMYLMLLAEQGILGGALYAALVVVLARIGFRMRQTARSPVQRDRGSTVLLMALYFVFIGSFSHNVLEEAFTTYALAFMLSMPVAARHPPNRSQVDSKLVHA